MYFDIQRSLPTGDSCQTVPDWLDAHTNSLPPIGDSRTDSYSYDAWGNTSLPPGFPQLNFRSPFTPTPSPNPDKPKSHRFFIHTPPF